MMNPMIISKKSPEKQTQEIKTVLQKKTCRIKFDYDTNGMDTKHEAQKKMMNLRLHICPM